MSLKARTLSAIHQCASQIESLEPRTLFTAAAPVAVDDVFTVMPGNSVTGNVLTNDRDAQNDSLSAMLVIGVARGQLTFNANGSFTYTPMLGFFGVDQFSYMASDGTNTSKIAYAAIDVGYIAKTSSISGTVYGDGNDNGSFDAGETGLAGRTVFLDANNNGVLDSGEVTTTTNSKGVYTFSNLAGGPYRLAQVLPDGSVQTEPGKGGEWVIPLGTGQNITGRDFGVYKPATLSGTVFNDLNDNGVQDSNEPILSGWQIYIDSNNDGRLDDNDLSANTDANGNFSFANLTTGTYQLHESPPTGWRNTTPASVSVKLSMGVTTFMPFGNMTHANYAYLYTSPKPMQVGSPASSLPLSSPEGFSVSPPIDPSVSDLVLGSVDKNVL